jgi:ribosomal protein L32E
MMMMMFQKDLIGIFSIQKQMMMKHILHLPDHRFLRKGWHGKGKVASVWRRSWQVSNFMVRCFYTSPVFSLFFCALHGKPQCVKRKTHP